MFSRIRQATLIDVAESGAKKTPEAKSAAKALKELLNPAKGAHKIDAASAKAGTGAAAASPVASTQLLAAFVQKTPAILASTTHFFDPMLPDTSPALNDRAEFAYLYPYIDESPTLEGLKILGIGGARVTANDVLFSGHTTMFVNAVLLWHEYFDGLVDGWWCMTPSRDPLGAWSSAIQPNEYGPLWHAGVGDGDAATRSVAQGAEQDYASLGSGGAWLLTRGVGFFARQMPSMSGLMSAGGGTNQEVAAQPQPNHRFSNLNRFYLAREGVRQGVYVIGLVCLLGVATSRFHYSVDVIVALMFSITIWKLVHLQMLTIPRVDRRVLSIWQQILRWLDSPELQRPLLCSECAGAAQDRRAGTTGVTLEDYLEAVLEEKGAIEGIGKRREGDDGHGDGGGDLSSGSSESGDTDDDLRSFAAGAAAAASNGDAGDPELGGRKRKPKRQGTTRTKVVPLTEFQEFQLNDLQTAALDTFTISQKNAEKIPMGRGRAAAL